MLLTLWPAIIQRGRAFAGDAGVKVRKVLVTIKGARFLVPESELDAWLEKQADEIVCEAKKDVKKGKRIGFPVIKVSAKEVQPEVRLINDAIMARIKALMLDIDDEDILCLMI